MQQVWDPYYIIYGICMISYFQQLTSFLSECSKSGNQIADHITSTYYGQCGNIFISEIIFNDLLNDITVWQHFLFKTFPCSSDKQHDEYDHMFPGGEEEDNVDNSRKKSLALRFYINHLKLLNIFSFLTSSSFLIS